MLIMDLEEKSRRINIVIDVYAGIYPVFEAFYIESIIYAARSSTDAFERFARYVIDDAEPSLIVSAIQEALTHAAGLSRFFWPARERDKLAMARAKRLREAFKMEGSALQNRDLRNAIEHFDERLDDFLLNDPCGIMLPNALVEPYTINRDQTGHIFRLVDPYECVFVILGNEHKFLPIHLEVVRILELAEKFSDNGSRLGKSF
jgi:hypothetical protein